MLEKTLVKNLIKFKGNLEAMLIALVRNPNVAEDLFQEVGLIMTQKRNDLDEDVPFLIWGRRIALNVVRNYYRKSKQERRVRFFDAEALEILAGVVERTKESVWGDRKLAMQECINKLSEKHRCLLRDKYERNVSVNELSPTLSTTREATDSMIYRIRKALRKCVELRLHHMGAHSHEC